MTYPAHRYLKDDKWFGPAVLSAKSMSELKTAKPVVTKELIHEVMYKMASKEKLSCCRDQPWVSGAGR